MSWGIAGAPVALARLARHRLEIEHHRGQRLVQFVRDGRAHLVYGVDTRHAHQLRLDRVEPLVGLDLGAQVAHDADELTSRRGGGFANRKLQRENGSVLVLALHRPADADDAAHPGIQIRAHVIVVMAGIGFRHQHLHVAPDGLLGGVAEQRFASLVEDQDAGALVDHDYSIDSGVQHAFKACLRRGNLVIPGCLHYRVSAI